MDFVTHLPKSPKNCDAIWVVVDRLKNLHISFHTEGVTNSAR